jgi:tRNA 2-thiouridine synthesizing protein A
MAPPEPPARDALLDAQGMSCGELEPLLWRTMHRLEAGQVLEIRSDFPAARDGVPSWCWLTGHTLVTMIEEDARRTRFFVKRPPPDRMR